MAREFNVIIERDSEGWLVASVPELEGCHTQAKSHDILLKRIREAISLYKQPANDVPRSFVGIERVSI